MAKKEKILEGVLGTIKRKASSSFTVKSLGQNIRKLKELNMATEEELNKLKEIHKAITHRWLSVEMFNEEETEKEV